MKNLVSIAAIVGCIFLLSVYAFGKGGNIDSSNNPIQLLPKETLSEQEREGLLLMREEEKLAHDIYAALYEKWNIQIFNNIAGSELQHTDRVRALLERYEIADPVIGSGKGEYRNADLEQLYITLVEQGSQSLGAALQVGATVEDLDIKDLQDLLLETDNQDIRLVYENLLRGSRNHIRSFNRQLKQQGINYGAQYITEQELNSILNSPLERGKNQ